MDFDMNGILYELNELRKENARLRELLTKHGILVDDIELTKGSVVRQLSLEEKVNLFRRRFVGREDVFARRWYSSSTGKSGYQPVCSRKSFVISKTKLF